MLTRMLVPKPKKAFQSPGVHSVGLNPVVVLIIRSPVRISVALSAAAKAASICFEPVTQPKMPPCALIIFRPMSWNSGKYDAQQSASTTQR